MVIPKSWKLSVKGVSRELVEGGGVSRELAEGGGVSRKLVEGGGVGICGVDWELEWAGRTSHMGEFWHFLNVLNGVTCM